MFEIPLCRAGCTPKPQLIEALKRIGLKEPRKRQRQYEGYLWFDCKNDGGRLQVEIDSNEYSIRISGGERLICLVKINNSYGVYFDFYDDVIEKYFPNESVSPTLVSSASVGDSESSLPELPERTSPAYGVLFPALPTTKKIEQPSCSTTKKVLPSCDDPDYIASFAQLLLDFNLDTSLEKEPFYASAFDIVSTCAKEYDATEIRDFVLVLRRNYLDLEPEKRYPKLLQRLFEVYRDAMRAKPLEPDDFFRLVNSFKKFVSERQELPEHLKARYPLFCNELERRYQVHLENTLKTRETSRYVFGSNPD